MTQNMVAHKHQTHKRIEISQEEPRRTILTLETMNTIH